MRALWLLLALAVAWPVTAASRVVSLAPSLTEIVVELHAEALLVGVLDAGERPAQLASLASVGRYGQLDLERLLSLKPDLILLWPASVPPAQRAQLERLGIPLYSAEPHDLDGLITQIEAIGERLGRAEAARAYAANQRARLQALRTQYRRDEPLRVFYQVWDQPLYTVGAGQIISDALKVCGARNVFDDLPLPAPQVSIESVLLRDPQVIVAGDAAQLAAWQRWTQLSAVRQGQVLLLPDKGLERPSGQMIEATAKLCRLLATAPASS